MSASPELDAHPLCQLARVLTWGALALLAYGAIGWVIARPWFALTTLEVKAPVTHVTEAQIRLIAERKVHGTFFTVDLEQVRDSFEKLPWVREARVERRWPDALAVSLVEHEPLARWNDHALINVAGETFVAAFDARLPRLSGPEDSGAEVVAAYRRHESALAPLGMRISELALSERRAWRMRLDNGLTLALGRDKTDARLARFVALYPRLFGAQAGTPAVLPLAVDLRYPDGMAVRMPGGAAPAGFAAVPATPVKPNAT